MSYLIKVLTPEFKQRVETQVQLEVEAALKEKHIPVDRDSFAKRFQYLMTWDAFYAMWNDADKFPDSIKEHYRQLGLWTPEFSEMTVEEQDKGLQSKARILWNNKITRIDDVKEIFSYKIV